MVIELADFGWEYFGRIEVHKPRSKLALGTAQFGFPYGIANQQGQVNRVDAKAMLEFAFLHGIDTLDTAIAYGESETCLGEVGTQGFRIITKLPSLPENCSDLGCWVREQVSVSLARLEVSSVYGLLLHCPEQLLGDNGKKLYRVLLALKDRGNVQKVGISIYGPNELQQLNKRFHFDLVQAPFNLIDQRLSKSGWLQRLKDDNVEIHTRSAFLQGLLLMPQQSIPTKFTPWNELWEKWYKWLSDQNVSAVQACLAFPLSFPEIDRVIVGADSVNQLQQILEAASTATDIPFPNISCDDEDLINPSRWSQL